MVAAIGSIVDWSIGAASRLGYFAAMYKRITIAVGVAIERGVFADGPRMERLDVVFAGRYLDAVNAYLHPGRYPKPTRSWQVTFDAAAQPRPVVLQHLLAGMNAHIALDLGIAAQTVAPGRQLASLHDDFNKINAVLAGQVNGLVREINEISPVLAEVYGVLMDNQIFLINQGVTFFRDGAWRFAAILAHEPEFAHAATVWLRDRQVARRGDLIYHPTALAEGLVEAVAARESRDVVNNIRVLAEIASTPAPISTTM